MGWGPGACVAVNMNDFKSEREGRGDETCQLRVKT